MKRRGSRVKQRVFGFIERQTQRDRLFKRILVGGTLLAALAIVAGSPSGRRFVASNWLRAAALAERSMGLEVPRTEVDRLMALRRARGVIQTKANLDQFYRRTTPELRRLFDIAGMNPADGLIRWGFGDQAFLISSRVFESDEKNRSFKLKPNVRSVWLRQITINGGPFGMFLVPDLPDVRSAAVAAGAIVDEQSLQTTNSWGFRGDEPDPRAPRRGIVLGDSFMLGMFVGNRDAPPAQLEKALSETWRQRVSVLNTGSIGYGPEQYFYTLSAVGNRFNPQFVVVSVCPNDFGDASDVFKGQGDWSEAAYWLDEIHQWCRSRNVLCVLAIVPCDVQFMGTRNDSFYPGQISNIHHVGPLEYCNPLEEFINEHIKIVDQVKQRTGERPQTSPLYNREIADNHFSPLGSALWAKSIGRRVALLTQAKGHHGDAQPLP